MAATLLVGTEKGLFALEGDVRREHWELRGPVHAGWQVYSLFVNDRPDDPEVYAGLSHAVYGAHLQRSRDGGRTWTAIEHGPRFPEGSPRRLRQIWSVAAGSRPGSLWAGVADAALFFSQDGGESWTLNTALEEHPTRERWFPGAGGLCLHTIVVDPTNPVRIFIGISAVGIFRSDDGGHSWAVKNRGVGAVEVDEQAKYSEIMRCVHKFVQDPADHDRLYQQNHTGVYRSRDAGDSWERIEEGLSSRFGFPMVAHPRRPGTLFVVPQVSDELRLFPEGRAAVYRTDDAGDHWVRTGPVSEEPYYGGVLRNAMTIDRLDPVGIYFGTTNGDVYCSLDEGESWRRLPGRFPRIQSLAALVF